MTAHSTTKAPKEKKTKPAKPRPDFPLFAHACGKWSKTICGKGYYFGRWDDPEGALREYLDAKDDLYAGRTPTSRGGIAIREACNAFMEAKRIAMDAGQLSARSFVGYDTTCKAVIAQLGANRLVADLGPGDFQKIYSHLARKHSIVTMGREITVVRGIFKHAFDADLIDRPVKFGPMFKVPSKAKQRKHRAKQEQANGQKVFEAAEIRAMLNAADVQLRAMILLGINGALGNTDCANLPFAALDLKKAWLDYARVKTGVDRRVPLWPETVAALEAAIAARPQPKDPADANVVFVTKFGQRWVRYQVTEEKRFGKKVIKPKFDDAVAKAAAKLLNKLGIKRHRLGFYALRHTFETIAGGSKDQAAVDAIMGHVDPSMAATHRHGIDDARLHAVVDHVRAWLFPKVDGKIS